MLALPFWCLFGCLLDLPAATARPVDDCPWWLALILASANTQSEVIKDVMSKGCDETDYADQSWHVLKQEPCLLVLAAGLPFLQLLCCVDVESCSSLRRLALLHCPHLQAVSARNNAHCPVST